MQIIRIQESNEMYGWLLLSQAEMEPRWYVSNIRLIFVDVLLGNQLLVDLGISDTCILRGDHYHLMNEIWLTEIDFGNIYYLLIKQHILKMLTSNSKSEWRFIYLAARKLVSGTPLKVGKIDTIYQKPSYYDGCYLRNIT